MIKVATIAGSDASGGAGLEADLKTFEEYGLYGMAVVTVIATMDPDHGWSHQVFPLPENVVEAQMHTVFKGVGVEALKSGMLGTSYAVDLTSAFIRKYNIKNYVLDPVMVCKGAGEALNPELNQAIAEKLLPLAEIVTPNIFEASQLSGLPESRSIEELKESACIIAGKGARNIYIKGGAKLPNTKRALDLFYDGKNFEIIEEDLLKTTWTHGAGCTTAAAITAGLAQGLSPIEAVRSAKKFITTSLSAGFSLNEWVGVGNPSHWRKK